MPATGVGGVTAQKNKREPARAPYLLTPPPNPEVPKAAQGGPYPCIPPGTPERQVQQGSHSLEVQMKGRLQDNLLLPLVRCTETKSQVGAVGTLSASVI